MVVEYEDVQPCKDCRQVKYRGGVMGPWYCRYYEAWISEIRCCRAYVPPIAGGRGAREVVDLVDIRSVKEVKEW